MHGPTFMANALACAVSVASVELLLGQDWRGRGRRDQRRAGRRAWSPRGRCPVSPTCGCCGAIGVIETREPVDLTHGHPGGAGPRGVAAAVPQPHLRHAAVHLHARRDRPDHLGDGRRRACTNLNGVQVRAEEHPVTRLGLSPLAWLDTVEQQRRQAGLRRSLRARPAVAMRTRPGLQRLSRPVPASRRDRRRRRRAAHLGCGLHRLPAGHRQHRTARGVRGRAGRIRRRRVRVWCSPRATPPTSARWSRCPVPGSLLVSDAFSHASLVDACRLSRARVVVTPAPRRRRRRGRAGRPATRNVRWSSPTRCSAPTARWRRCAGCTRSAAGIGALLLVDEAHGLGVRGAGGRGLLHEVGLAGAPDVVVTTTHVEVAGQPGRRGARPGGGARPPDRRRPPVHLRHRTDPGRGRRRRRRPRGADRRAVAGRGRHQPRAASWPTCATSPRSRSPRWCR